MHPLSVEDTMHFSLICFGKKVNTQSIKCAAEVVTIVQVFEDVGGSLGNLFLLCTKRVPAYTHCVTSSQEDIYRVKAFYIRGFMVMSFI